MLDVTEDALEEEEKTVEVHAVYLHTFASLPILLQEVIEGGDILPTDAGADIPRKARSVSGSRRPTVSNSKIPRLMWR